LNYNKLNLKQENNKLKEVIKMLKAKKEFQKEAVNNA